MLFEQSAHDRHPKYGVMSMSTVPNKEDRLISTWHYKGRQSKGKSSGKQPSFPHQGFYCKGHHLQTRPSCQSWCSQWPPQGWITCSNNSMFTRLLLLIVSDVTFRMHFTPDFPTLISTLSCCLLWTWCMSLSWVSLKTSWSTSFGFSLPVVLKPLLNLIVGRSLLLSLINILLMLYTAVSGWFPHMA